MPESFPAGPLCTCKSLANQFRELGVNHGDTLLVHSSLSSLGWVNGGAEAVVLALLDVLGDKGTLVVPTHSSDNSDPAHWQHPPVPEEWKPIIRETMLPYSPRTTRTALMGVIAETVRTWPGAIRSAHPQTSFAAVGLKAEPLMADHALDCALGEQSPIAKLETVDSRVLLLGVGFDCCTAFHLAEHRIPRGMMENSFSVMTEEGRSWMTVRDTATSGDRFDELGADFEREQQVIRGKIGAAEARLFPIADAVAYAQRWLSRNRPYIP
ncbi:aminoglycoside acetyltransferase [Stipitochalara longipes BDJ]|nr:aminoglycoside acetyltransferase [Stipitochalara longipes BDJ]